jgi:hypothetical protein
MDLVDFYKVFDEWHCGLNQLKKFNRVPIEWWVLYLVIQTNLSHNWSFTQIDTFVYFRENSTQLCHIFSLSYIPLLLWSFFYLWLYYEGGNHICDRKTDAVLTFQWDCSFGSLHKKAEFQIFLIDWSV